MGFGLALVACAEDEKTLTLPHGDALTVPESYEFRQQIAFDSLHGTLQDGDGKKIFTYDACGIGSFDLLAGFDIQERGEAGRSVNADFYYGHFPENWPGLLVMFPSRGRSAFVFGEHITDAAALSLVETLSAKDPSDDPCYVEEP